MNFSIQVHKAKLRRNNHEIPSPPFLCGPVSHFSWFLISDFLLCHFLSLFFSLSLSHIHVLLSFLLSFPSSLLPPFYFLSPLLPSFFLSLPHLPPQGLSIGACHFPQCDWIQVCVTCGLFFLFYAGSHISAWRERLGKGEWTFEEAKQAKKAPGGGGVGTGPALPPWALL